MKNQNRTNWKETYLRILTSGPAGEEDFGPAAQLIADGYAAGPVRFSSERGIKEADLVIWQGTTIKGRLFADQLAGQTRSARLKSLAVKALIAIVSAGFGLGVAMLQKQVTGC